MPRHKEFFAKIRIAALALAVGAFVGCVHVDQSLTINPDGSGTLEVRYGMPLETIAQMESMSKQAATMEGITNEVETKSPFDFNEDEIRKDFKEYEHEKVYLDSVESTESNGWKFIHLNVRFADLNGLTKTELVADRTMSLTKNDDGSYTFKQVAPEAANDMTHMEGVDQTALNEMMAQMMKGFHATLRVNLPGDVLDTNAQQHEDKSATWEFDLEKDPHALERAQKLNMFVKFNGQGLDLKELGGTDKTD